MSRIGKQPIEIPEGVEIKIDQGEIRIKGPKGELIQDVPREIEVTIEDKKVMVKLKKGTNRQAPALWGLSRALIFNMIKGVTQGYEKKLEIEGVGYRVALEGKKLVLNLGFSHPIEVEAPEGIEFKIEKNLITVSGINKQLVGQVASNIRDKKKPEPYKGKGIHYLGEVIKRKAGKKTAGVE